MKLKILLRDNMESSKVSLYDLLGVRKEATQPEIAKAYRLMALMVHPDKNPNALENAQKNFQRLNEAYGILMDPQRRGLYDLTGETQSSEDFFEAYEYYRGVYPKITVEDIESFAVKYKDSSEEVEDLVRYYLASNGNMREILFHVPLSERSDLPRFWRILDELIIAKKLPKMKKYTASKKRVKNIKEFNEEIVEDEKGQEDKKENSMQSLISKIKGKQTKDPAEFFDYLEQKYSEKPSKRKKQK